MKIPTYMLGLQVLWQFVVGIQFGSASYASCSNPLHLVSTVITASISISVAGISQFGGLNHLFFHLPRSSWTKTCWSAAVVTPISQAQASWRDCAPSCWGRRPQCPSNFALKRTVMNHWLVVWYIHVLFPHILGIIILTDYFSEGLKPPTRSTIRTALGFLMDGVPDFETPKMDRPRNFGSQKHWWCDQNQLMAGSWALESLQLKWPWGSPHGWSWKVWEWTLSFKSDNLIWSLIELPIPHCSSWFLMVPKSISFPNITLW